MEKISSEALKKAMETLGLSTEQPAAAQAEKTDLQKAEEEMIAVQAKIEKLKNPATSSNDLNKSEVAEQLNKAFDEKFKALGMILTSKDDQIENLTKAIGDLTEQNSVIGKRLGIVERTPLERKSISEGIQVRERFEKGGDNTQPNGMKVISIKNSNERRYASKLVLDEAIAKGGDVNGTFTPNPELAKAAQQIELRQVGPEVAQLLREKFNIKVTA